MSPIQSVPGVEDGDQGEGLFRVNPPRSFDRKRRNPAVFIRHGGGQSGTDTGANRSSVCSSPLVEFAVKCSGQDSPDGSFKGTSVCKRPSAQSRNMSEPLVLQFRIKLSLPAAAPPHYDSLSLKMFVCFLDCTGCFYLWSSGDWSAGFSTRRKWRATFPPTKLRSKNLRFFNTSTAAWKRSVFSDIIDQKYNISVPMLRQIRLQVWSWVFRV